MKATPLTISRPGVYKCHTCRKQFSVTVGTPLEHTRLPLAKWLRAIDLLYVQRTASTAATLAAGIAVNCRTAWLVISRLRRALCEAPIRGPDPASLDEAAAAVLRAGRLPRPDYVKRLEIAAAQFQQIPNAVTSRAVVRRSSTATRPGRKQSKSRTLLPTSAP